MRIEFQEPLCSLGKRNHKRKKEAAREAVDHKVIALQKSRERELINPVNANVYSQRPT